MPRRFTPREANKELREIRPLVEELVAHRREQQRLQAQRQALAHRIAGNGAGIDVTGGSLTVDTGTSVNGNESTAGSGGGIAFSSAGTLTIGLACVRDSELARRAARAIEVVSGPEVVAGSTRMKAGTAQKLVLNTISTIAMVRLGKTFGNLMVDVQASNEKLRARARRAVAIATAAAEDEVADAIAAADGDTKVAIVSLLAGVDAQTARSRLTAAHGVIREAVADVVG